ncbi:MAG: hypothetical protein GWO08_11380, partial [Gammaproteobacteria bacterium]|nr:hypothetical protein [Phycisphaerae bacterium]NIR94235.1 hypothetical protein [Gammaproteobacteria bacterium]NIW49395.1 hypothetical protein [Gammaproteobacteria bacterium]
MKTLFRTSAVAVAVASITTGGVAFAQGNTTNNVTNVSMTKNLSLSKTLTIEGTITVDGVITPDSASVAVIDDKQSSTTNQGDNFLLKNTATAGDEVMSGASGNIGLNMVSG